MYAEMVRDMVRWRQENPDNWEKTWGLAEKKYNQDRNYNISALDVKLEGRLGADGPALRQRRPGPDDDHLLPLRLRTATAIRPVQRRRAVHRRGLVAACPTATTASLTNKRSSATRRTTSPRCSTSARSWLARPLAQAGGRIEKDAAGEEVFVIPRQTPAPSRFEDLKTRADRRQRVQ